MDQEEQHDDLGFMEFFDWLAGTSDTELCTVAESQSLARAELRPQFPLSARCRHDLGLRVWAAM